MSEATDYALIDRQLEALLDGETDRLAMAANCVALVDTSIPDVNWLGIYVLRGDELVLGPFQGQPACVHIPLGAGVCGTAAKRNETLRVDDVHAFPGHIVCDSASNAEIVVPLTDGDEVLGVLDVDSPSRGRFDESDQDGLEKLARRLVRAMVSAPRASNGLI